MNKDKIEEKFKRIIEKIESEKLNEKQTMEEIEKNFSEEEKEALMEVLGMFFGEVSSMTENPKEYFFNNEAEKKLQEKLSNKKENSDEE
ncbi:MAG: chromosome segregation protein SMC [Kosmotogaceae bacterium]